MEEISCEDFKNNYNKDNYYFLNKKLNKINPDKLHELCNLKIISNNNILYSIAEIFSYDDNYNFFFDENNIMQYNRNISFYWIDLIIVYLINIYDKESFNKKYNEFLNKLFVDFNLYRKDFIFLNTLKKEKKKEIELDKILNNNKINFKYKEENEIEVSIKNIKKKYIYLKLFTEFFFGNQPSLLEIYEKFIKNKFKIELNKKLNSETNLDTNVKIEIRSSGTIYVEHKNYGFEFEVIGDFLQLKNATGYGKKKKGDSCTVSLTKAISELLKKYPNIKYIQLVIASYYPAAAYFCYKKAALANNFKLVETIEGKNEKIGEWIKLYDEYILKKYKVKLIPIKLNKLRQHIEIENKNEIIYENVHEQRNLLEKQKKENKGSNIEKITGVHHYMFFIKSENAVDNKMKELFYIDKESNSDLIYFIKSHSNYSKMNEQLKKILGFQE